MTLLKLLLLTGLEALKSFLLYNHSRFFSNIKSSVAKEDLELVVSQDLPRSKNALTRFPNKSCTLSA